MKVIKEGKGIYMLKHEKNSLVVLGCFILICKGKRLHPNKIGKV